MGTNTDPRAANTGKAVATLGFWIMLFAGLGGIALTGILMAADQIRVAYGVDLIQHATVGIAIVGAAFFIGKSIHDYGKSVAAGGDPYMPGTVVTPPGGDGGGVDPGDIPPQ